MSQSFERFDAQTINITIKIDEKILDRMELLLDRLISGFAQGAPVQNAKAQKNERWNSAAGAAPGRSDAGAAAGIAPAASAVVEPPHLAAAPDPAPQHFLEEMGDGRMWTPQRDALLTAMYENGDSLPVILQSLRALPGLPIAQKEALERRCYRLRLKRPAGYGRSSARASNVWTEQRVAYLQRAYPADTKLETMLDALNRMPGDKVANMNAISVKAAKLQLRRTGMDKTVPQASVMYGLRERAPGARRELSALTDYETARQWASQRGLCNGIDGVLDVDAVNQRRKSLGLPPFVIKDKRAVQAGAAL
jgi:hypothetical protein